MRNTTAWITLIAITLLGACRTEELIVPSTSTDVGEAQEGEIKGFFLLNEGNMGSNNATLDFYDYTTATYNKNIFGERNPYVVKELGDVGNDLAIWGNRLYAVVNCSNLVEVMDLSTAVHIGQVAIPNCRSLAFDGSYAFVSSYAGQIEDDNKRLGYVAKIDTATLEVVATCAVGYQPEEMAISGGKLYVANSGGYNAPDYDTTLSVIELESFTLSHTIEVGINLRGLVLDSYGALWVSSRGNYSDIPSQTYVVDTATDTVVESLSTLPNSSMAIAGDSLYVCSSEWSSVAQKNTTTYAIVDTESRRILSRNFITDGTEEDITLPYSIAVNPSTRELLVTDAKNYLSSGTLHCYSPEGVLKWSATTGEIPSSIVFSTLSLEDPPLE